MVIYPQAAEEQAKQAKEEQAKDIVERMLSIEAGIEELQMKAEVEQAAKDAAAQAAAAAKAEAARAMEERVRSTSRKKRKSWISNFQYGPENSLRLKRRKTYEHARRRQQLVGATAGGAPRRDSVV